MWSQNQNPSDANGDTEMEKRLKMVGEYLDRPLINSKWTNAFKVKDLFYRMEMVSHPFEYMTTLLQIGYEPIPPTISKSIFGRTRLQLPGFFSYMNYVIKSDGFFGIYRGLRYNVTYSIAFKFVHNNMDSLAKRTRAFRVLNEKDAKYKDWKTFTLSLTCDTITRFVTLTVAYPAHVMMVRSMAQFIGRETHYDSFFGAILDIYYTGGFSGFYAGFWPFFLGQCILLYIESSIVYLLRNQVDKSLELYNNQFLLSSISIITRSLVYPFRIVSTIMSCNGSSARSLTASAYTSPQFDSWTECWATLWRRGEIKRGSSLFWRYQPITSSLMFPMQPLPQIRRQKQM